MRATIACWAATLIGCSCLQPGPLDAGSTDSGIDAFDALTDAGEWNTDGGSDAAVDDPHVCQRVIATDAGVLCVSMREVTSQFFAVQPDADYLSVAGGRAAVAPSLPVSG